MSQTSPRNTSSASPSLKSGEQRAISQPQRVSRGLRVWRWLHWFSFDIALGAGVSAMWIGRAWGSDPSPWAIIALSCGALWVYSVDHWADAGKVRTLATHQISDRRAFYVRMRLWLVLIAAFSVIIGGWASFRLPWFTLTLGVMCLMTCMVYLWMVQHGSDHARVRYPKEMLITTLYTLALSLWPISQLFDPPATFTPIAGGLSSLFIFCLAWSNLCLISVHERRFDAAEGSASLALRLGEFTTRNVGRGTLRLATVLWGARFIPMVLFGQYQSIEVADALASALMLITLWRLYRQPEWSAHHSRYRLWADLIFIYPALGLIIETI